jgi:hypothetical protein
MLRVGTYSAEDSCFIKYHSQDDAVLSVESYDVERAAINHPGGPAAGPPVVETIKPSPLKEEGLFEESHGSGSVDSTLTHNEDEDDFPEGGLKAWSVVVGSFCGSFSVFGIINSTAILLEYFSANQLKDYNPSQIGWIFGLSLFLTFFCGAPIGPIFDAYGPRALIFAGSVLLVASMFLLGLCTRKCLPNAFGINLLTS